MVRIQTVTLSLLVANLISFYLNASGPVKTIFCPEHYTQKEHITPENTACYFDIHDTLLTRDYLTLIKTILYNPLYTTKLAYALYCNQSVKNGLQDAKKMPGEHYILVPAQHDQYLADNLAVGLSLCNSYKPITGIPELIKQFHDNGYTLAILSNIGHAAYHGLDSNHKKPSIGLKKHHPQVFDHFDCAIVEAKKPDYDVFAKVRAENPQKHLIFVDDKLENVLAAQRNGFIGIVFRSVEQLKQDLIQLGILAPTAKDASNQTA